MALLWRRHRWTALRSLLLVALLHRLHCLAFLAASSPVWLLAAFLLGVVLVHSDPHVPLAATEDEDRHLYKKIRRRVAASSSSSSSSSSSGSGGGGGSSDDTSGSMEHLVGDYKEEEVVKKPAAVAWTADDEHSIRSIGSLELERDARLEKLMSRRSIHRNLIDLDIHIPAAVLTKNPALDLHSHHHESSEPGSAPSFLLAQHNTNPFDFPPETLLYRRHESFTAGAPLARPSRFRPYFVADVPEAGGGDTAGSDNSNSSSSPSSSAASIDHQLVHHQGQAAQQQAPAAPGIVVAVDVELISDSSDDDMSLPGDDVAARSLDDIVVPPDEDVEDSFEVKSITQQVAAAGTCRGNGAATTAVEMVSSSSAPSPSRRQWHQEEDASISSMASVEENDKIGERHILGPVPVIDSSPTSAGAGVGAAGAVVAAAAPAAAAAALPATPAAAAAPLPAAAKPPATPAAAAPPATPAAAAPPAPAPAASAPSAKPSSKSKGSSKKAVFGFFRK
ncbi:unnamed protein product [Urochloa humidicola]